MYTQDLLLYSLGCANPSNSEKPLSHPVFDQRRQPISDLYNSQYPTTAITTTMTMIMMMMEGGTVCRIYTHWVLRNRLAALVSSSRNKNATAGIRWQLLTGRASSPTGVGSLQHKCSLLWSVGQAWQMGEGEELGKMSRSPETPYLNERSFYAEETSMLSFSLRCLLPYRV